MAPVNEGSHSFTCQPLIYPQLEWTIHAFNPSHRASPHFDQYSFFVPLRVEGWVGLSGWLQTEVVYPLLMVTHPSTNQARCRVTSLIETNMLPLDQAATRAICLRYMQLTFTAYHFWATVWPLSICCVCPVLSVKLVYCGQTIEWIKVKLGMQVGLDPGNVALDGHPALPATW